MASSFYCKEENVAVYKPTSFYLQEPYLSSGFYGNVCKNHVMLRFIGSVLVIVWMWIVRVYRAITGKRSKKEPPQNTGVQSQSEWTVKNLYMY